LDGRTVYKVKFSNRTSVASCITVSHFKFNRFPLFHLPRRLLLPHFSITGDDCFTIGFTVSITPSSSIRPGGDVYTWPASALTAKLDAQDPLVPRLEMPQPMITTGLFSQLTTCTQMSVFSKLDGWHTASLSQLKSRIKLPVTSLRCQFFGGSLNRKTAIMIPRLDLGQG